MGRLQRIETTVILSKTSEYGVQIVLHLAVNAAPGKFLPAREIARECEIPFYFLGKICYRLTLNGILGSCKGPNGGVALARSPQAITLLEVVQALDGFEGIDRCLLGLPNCGSGSPCPVHDQWKAIKGEILDTLSGQTVADLAAQVTAGTATISRPARRAASEGPAGGRTN